MPIPPLASPILIHTGSGRPAHLVRAESLTKAEPVGLKGQKYVLVTVSERADAIMSVEQARRWLEAGAAYVCSWGPGSSAMEESFDYASFLPKLGVPFPYTVMTTSHPKETMEEALWFAFWNARPPDDQPDPISSVMVLLDSASLETRCTEWIKTNRE
jgi:hypothetical protein